MVILKNKPKVKEFKINNALFKDNHMKSTQNEIKQNEFLTSLKTGSRPTTYSRKKIIPLPIF